MQSVQAESFSFAAASRRLARERPDHVALVTPARSLTYGQLDQRSSRIASALREAGVGSGDRVAVLIRNGAEFFEIAFAVSKCDAILVALNWRLSARELSLIVEDARPAVLFADPQFADLLAPSDRSERVVWLGEDHERFLAAAAGDDPGARPTADEVMMILYSSGTTGQPKGVMLTNENLSYIEVMARRLFYMSSESVHLVVAPLFHIGGAATGLTTTMLGGRTIVPAEADPDDILATIERERVTHAFFVPAIIQRLIESPAAADHDLSSLEYIAYGGAPMSETLLRRALEVLGCGFVGCYGMTETSATVIALAPAEHVPDGPQTRLLRSVGRPLDWHEARVTDLQTGQEAAPGQIGEIWVRSPMNMAGYFNQPQTTAQTLTADGWLRTGDGAYRDEEGYFFLTDRIKDVIISGGENVYPAEVENVLADHPGVSEVAVIGAPSERWGETVMAIVVPRDGRELAPAQLIEFARSQLAHYKCPTMVQIVAELPRNPTGKIIKKTLRERFSGVAVAEDRA